MGFAARANLIHTVLLIAAALITAVFMALPSAFCPALGPRLWLSSVLFIVAVSCVGAAFVLQQRCAAPSPPASADQWWAANFDKALVSWALLESSAGVGAIFHFFTGSYQPLVVSGAALLLLALFGPQGMIRPESSPARSGTPVTRWPASRSRAVAARLTDKGDRSGQIRAAREGLLMTGSARWELAHGY